MPANGGANLLGETTAMVDNIYWLPRSYGDALRAHYEDLLKQPLSPQLEDLVARLKAAGAGSPPDMAAEEAPQPPDRPPGGRSESLAEPQPDPSE
jgi:hypothetical protein